MSSEHVSEMPRPAHSNHCPRCGAAVDVDRDNYCSRCAQPLTTGITTAVNLPPPDPNVKTFPIEQALLAREGNAEPTLWARSAAFGDDWVSEAQAMVLAFGVRPMGVACPRAVFARPFELDQVAVVQLADQPGGFLAFHFLVMDAVLYEKFLGDPFRLVALLPASWSARGSLPTHLWPRLPMPRRTIAEVREVLKRLKPATGEHVVAEGTKIERTEENSESPALLGGVQALVEGSRVVFERPAPDPHLIEGLWTLLPTATRGTLWPATFAFSNHLGFDALVVPRAEGGDYEGYIREQAAIEYPEGHYELNLQIAVEAGNEEELDALFSRSSLKQVWIMVVVLLATAILITILLNIPGEPR